MSNISYSISEVRGMLDVVSRFYMEYHRATSVESDDGSELIELINELVNKVPEELRSNPGTNIAPTQLDTIKHYALSQP